MTAAAGFMLVIEIITRILRLWLGTQFGTEM